MITAQVTSKGQMVIPFKLRRKYSITEGTRMVFDEQDGRITIQPLTEEYVKSVRGMLSSGATSSSDNRRKSSVVRSHDGLSATEELLKEHREELAEGK